jgi:hypothetical protein
MTKVRISGARTDAGFLVGADVKIYIDGREVNNLAGARIEIKPDQLVVAHLSFMDVELDMGDVAISGQKVSPTLYVPFRPEWRAETDRLHQAVLKSLSDLAEMLETWNEIPAFEDLASFDRHWKNHPGGAGAKITPLSGAGLDRDDPNPQE